MAYIRRGQVVTEAPLFGRLVAFFAAVVDFLIFFFKTIFDPTAADEYAAKHNRRGSGGGGGGPPKPPYRGPRVQGLSNLRDAGGNCAAGA